MSIDEGAKVRASIETLPSEKSFGMLFVCVFAILAYYTHHKNWHQFFVIGFLVIGVALIPISLIAPKCLSPLNRAWYRLGLILGRIVSPIVLGMIFFLLLTPISLVGRAFGRDELRLRKRKVASYWVERTPVGPTPESFKNQF